MRIAHSNTWVCLSAPANAGIDSRVSEKHEEESTTMRRSKHMYHPVKSPGEMSRQTTRTFKFKFNIRMPLTCPSTANCDPILCAANVLGVHHKYSPLIKFDLEFITFVKLRKHSLTAMVCWFLHGTILLHFFLESCWVCKILFINPLCFFQGITNPCYQHFFFSTTASSNFPPLEYPLHLVY